MKRLLKCGVLEADSGIRPIYAIDGAAWIWHPDVPPGAPAFVRFRVAFEAGGEALVCHVSADQRYELFLDGERVSRGPERSDVAHWSFSTYELELAPGMHTLEAEVWWLGEHAPLALMTHRGGFVFKAEGAYDAALTTGRGAWEAAARGGWTLTRTPMRDYHVIGDAQTIDGAGWFADALEWAAPCVVRGALEGSETGVAAPGWRLRPATLPDQVDRGVTPGRIRAAARGRWHAERVFTAEDGRAPDVGAWQGLLDGSGPLRVPPQTAVSVLWDLEDYYCGYTEAQVSGGAGSRIDWLWAESLYEDDLAHKGQRDAVTGKRFVGFGHTFLPDGQAGRRFRPYWWGSGRYCLLTVETGAEALTIEGLCVNETRYPLENEALWRCSDEALGPVTAISVRALQMCAHETYMDCPYYEQLMYVGDTRLEALTTYVTTRDDRLARRAIELFDFSRREFGFAAERYPCREPQLSLTFALLWVLMVHDYLMWRGDPEWVRERSIGVRANLGCFEPYVGRDGLLGALPGWSVMDWAPEWETGYPPGALEGSSSIVNLVYVLALQAAAEIEAHLGEGLLAQRYGEQAADVGRRVVERFWDEERGLVADEGTHTRYSEHAQCFALLAGALPAEAAGRALAGLLHGAGLARTTVYTRHYLFETLYRHGLGERLMGELAFWKALHAQGFKTTVEMPEPSRSDCHAWGAHPVFHMHASLLGIRPGAPGFEVVRMAPSPGRLGEIRARTPHPAGFIEAELRFEGGACTGQVRLPEGVRGELVWRGARVELAGGRTVAISCAADAPGDATGHDVA